MRKFGLLVFVIRALSAQTSPCDVNKDGVVNIADVQTEINEALGVTACTTPLSGGTTCSVVDVQIVITSALGGTCNAVQPAASTVQLPVEVIGLDGTTKAVSLSVPAGSNLSGTMQLSMQIHGLKYETQASVQVNNSAWMPINSSTVTIQGLGASYGGIGGGFKTLQMTMNLPAGTVVAGANTLTFKFNGTNGIVSGFRVLAVNILDASANVLIPSTAFTWEDPNTWQPPSTAAADIAAGKNWWYTAALTVPGSSGATAIQARCTSCHAQDGRDLKYFNYSNNSIETRSMFHGLTAEQGLQIASYIRSLSVPNPGRPWNPPYQPGPGLDALPVTDWAAGAGLSAVLARDVDMWAYLAPSNSTAGWATTGNLNAREMPVAFQFPDWNSWLPIIHPLDTFGSTFSSSLPVTSYNTIRAGLVAGNAQTYQNQSFNIWMLGADAGNFASPMIKVITDPSWNNATYTDSIYSVQLWTMVKLWEINQEFGLEGMASSVFGPNNDGREWYSSEPFFVSPNMIHIPTTAAGLGNGMLITADYLRFIWYHVQVVLNQRNNSGFFTGTAPIDFGYTFNTVNGLAIRSAPTAPQASLMLFWQIKGLQLASESGLGPQLGSAGWSLYDSAPWSLYAYASSGIWNDYTPANQVTATTAYLQNWINEASKFTPQQYYQGGQVKATDVPANPLTPNNGYQNGVAYSIAEYVYSGGSTALATQMVNWAQTIWPNFNWSLLLTPHCTPAALAPYCTV